MTGNTNSKTIKTPIYKRAWFWILIAIVILGGVGSVQSNFTNASPNAQNKSSQTIASESTEEQRPGTNDTSTDLNQNGQPSNAESSSSASSTQNISSERIENEEDDPINQSTEPITTTQLYDDFFAPYADFSQALLVNGFQTVEKLNDYQVEFTEGSEEDEWEYKIYDANGDYIYMMFFPVNAFDDPSEWIWTLSLLTYESGDKEISCNDMTHNKAPSDIIYTTFDRNRTEKRQEVGSVAELEQFMFGED